MKELKSEYKRGLLYFGGLMICICLWFTTPDGVNIYHGILGLFGISPGIPIGSGATLYIYGLLPLIATIICIKKVFVYWRGYGTRFKEFNAFLRLLPLFIALPVILLSNVIQPSLIDRMYYAILSQKNGLQAVSFFSAEDNLRYTFTGNYRTFTYCLALGNHSAEDVEFHLVFSYRDMDGMQEVYFMDATGDVKLFTLAPRQLTHYSGEFTAYIPTPYESGSGRSVFSVILLNENEQHKPAVLVRRPLL
jgi:hypothetical protein